MLGKVVSTCPWEADVVPGSGGFCGSLIGENEAAGFERLADLWTRSGGEPFGEGGCER